MIYPQQYMTEQFFHKMIKESIFSAFYYFTVYEEHALLLFSRRTKNSDWILQWWPMGKIFLSINK